MHRLGDRLHQVRPTRDIVRVLAISFALPRGQSSLEGLKNNKKKHCTITYLWQTPSPTRFDSPTPPPVVLTVCAMIMECQISLWIYCDNLSCSIGIPSILQLQNLWSKRSCVPCRPKCLLGHKESLSGGVTSRPITIATINEGSRASSLLPCLCRDGKDITNQEKG